MAFPFASLVALQLVQIASCAPSLAFPLNAQLPPVARLDKFFSYSFSPHTFSSGSKITYTLGSHPAWLSFESDQLRLYGTPTDSSVPSGDVVGQTVDIIATDDHGSTSMNATLVVSRNAPPTIRTSLEAQAEVFGEFAAPSSILSYPSTEFKYSFKQNTFDRQHDINYYAVSGDNSPLPAWMRFDAPTLTFSGQTPPFESLVEPPQTFSFKLVASDIIGFSAVSLPFSIVVGRHKLTTDTPVITLDTTRGSKFSYDDLEHGVKVDGKAPVPGSLRVTIENLPKWLSVDPKTQKLSGTPGESDQAANFTIHYDDPFADTLDVVVMVNVATGLFKSALEDLTAKAGSKFDLDLESYLRNPSDTSVDVTIEPDEKWLKVKGFKLSGKVPKSAEGSFKISVAAASKSSGIKETESLGVSFLARDGNKASATSSSPSRTAQSKAPKDTQAGLGEGAPDSQAGRLNTSEILLATIIPILFLAAIALVMMCFFRRRRRHQTYLASTYRSKISRPVANSPSSNGSNTSLSQSDGMSETVETFHAQTHQMFKPGKIAYAEISPHRSRVISSKSKSSETLGNASLPHSQPSPAVSARRTEAMPAVRNTAVEDDRRSEDRQSWITVEPTPTIHRGNSTRSNHSQISLPEPMIPTSNFLSEAGDGTFRRDLERAIPSLVELPSVQSTPAMAYLPPKKSGPRRSVDDIYSANTVGLAATRGYADPMKESYSDTSMGANTDGGRTWVTQADSEAASNMGGPRRPDLAFITNRLPGGQDGLSSNAINSEPSFGSTENWRAAGKKDNVSPIEPSTSYKNVVEDARCSPLRPNGPRDREGARPGERRSPDRSPKHLPGGRGGSPGKFSAHSRPSISLVSKISDGDESISGKVSERSFKVFI